MNIALLLVLVCMVLNTAAQLLLKETMIRIGAFTFSLHNFPVLFRVCLSPFFLAGLACYVLSLGVWLMVLSRMEVAVAYPLTSIAFIMTAIAASFFFHENFTMVRLLGIIIIIFGICLLTRT
jgi:multidrug transporter EmrE-like cation transporter